MSAVTTSKKRRRARACQSQVSPNDKNETANKSKPSDGEQVPWIQSTFTLALASGLVLWAAFPPIGWSSLAWVAPIGWLVLIQQEKLVGRKPYRGVWLAGCIYFMALLYFIPYPHWVLYFGWVALASYLAVYLLAFVGLCRVAVHQLRLSVVVAAPLVWVGLELARGHLFSGFSVALLGHTQVEMSPLIQIADLAGAYGVSFLVMFTAACISRVLPIGHRGWTWWPILPAAVVLAAVLFYGNLRLNEAIDRTVGDRSARVALIQGSIDTILDLPEEEAERYIEESFEHYRSLTQDARRQFPDVDLIVWPESKFPVPDVLLSDEVAGLIRDDSKLMRHIDETKTEFAEKLQQARGQNQQDADPSFSMIVGAQSILMHPLKTDFYNSALLIQPNGEIKNRYFKMHRVPFGEYLLFDEFYPWLYQFTPLPRPLTPGKQPQSFEVAGMRMSPSVCFESTVPHVIRRQINQLTRRGQPPDVLINITDDGWFRGSNSLDLHLTCTRFRAVENRLPILVAANTGFSASIDGNGELLEKGPRRDTKVLDAVVQPDGRGSLYRRMGDWPAGICLAFCVVCVGMAVNHRWRESRQTNA